MACHLLQVDEGHGIEHAKTVLDNCKCALFHETQPLNSRQRMSLLLSSLLHDADDRKFFGESVDFPHACRIAKEALDGVWSKEETEKTVKIILELIGYVSASKNKNSVVNERWKLIPRHCDRLEAIGMIGVKRCYEYNRHINAPLFTPNTPKVTNIEDLEKIAPR